MTTQIAVADPQKSLVLECTIRRIGDSKKDIPHGTIVDMTRVTGKVYHFKPAEPTLPADSPHICTFDTARDAKAIARLMSIPEAYRYYNPDLIESEKQEAAQGVGDPMAIAVGVQSDADPGEDKYQVPAYEGNLPDEFGIMTKREMVEWASKAIPGLELSMKWPTGRVGQMIRDAHAAGHKQ